MDNLLVLYKMYQLIDVIVNKYGYSQVMLQKYNDLIYDEAWFIDTNSTNYQVIRISFFKASEFSLDAARFNEYLYYFKTIMKDKDINILDIHIGKEEYKKENEIYDQVIVDENYMQGVEIDNIFPEIRTAIKECKNQDKLISDVLKRVEKTIAKKNKSHPFLLRHPHIVTDIVSIVCIIVFLISLYFKYVLTDDISAAFIILGADYKTFTLGLHQYYRLITYAFVHNDIIHLLCNLISLRMIGFFLESKYGHLKYTLLLFISIICGGLTQGILSDNSICIGLSGGIYGLLVAYIVTTIKMKVITLRQLVPTLCLNLFLNFLSTTAWMCHLGGAIAGFVMYYLYEDVKSVPRICLTFVFVLCLIIKYVTIDSINSLYAGTDVNVVKLFEKIGFKNYAEKLLLKLFGIYEKFGG